MPRRRHKNKKYSPELKIAVVEAYLSGKGSMEELAKKVRVITYISTIRNVTRSGFIA